MINKDIFMPKTEEDRRRAVSFTQIALSRVEDVIGDDVYFKPEDGRVRDLLSQYFLTDGHKIFSFVQRHFKEGDVRFGLGVNAENEQRVYIRLHCLIKAMDQSTPHRGTPFFFGR